MNLMADTRPPEPLCPACGRLYPFGDPRSVIAPPMPCFDCENAGRPRFSTLRDVDAGRYQIGTEVGERPTAGRKR
jgi:hypothetical protein